MNHARLTTLALLGALGCGPAAPPPAPAPAAPPTAAPQPAPQPEPAAASAPAPAAEPAAAPASQDAPVEAFPLTLNGRPYWDDGFKLSGLEKLWAEGDCVIVNHALVRLRAPGPWNFVTEEDKPFVWLERDGARTLVAACIDWSFPEKTKVVHDGLAELDDAQLRSLWGVGLNEWTAGTEARLAKIDVTAAGVRITNYACEGALRPLPAGIRWLALDSNSSNGFGDYSTLATYTELQALLLDNVSTGRTPFDGSLLKPLSKLEWLTADGEDLAGASVLATLPKLRVLEYAYQRKLPSLKFLAGAPALEVLALYGARNLKDISALASTPALRTLDLRGCGVTDLAPLAGLQALETVDCTQSRVEGLAPLSGLPALREVRANMTAVADLPGGALPALRRLEVMSTQLTAAQVAAFRTAYPDCVVMHGWKQSLEQALAGVDRVRVRSGGTCHRDPDQERTLLEDRDVKRIQLLIRNIGINAKRSGVHCMCCGEPTFEFYEGETLVSTLGFHHAQGLRWDDGPWPGDAILTPDSARGIVAWLGAHGLRMTNGDTPVAIPEAPGVPAPDAWAGELPLRTGRVVDGAGKPVAGATVRFSHAAAFWSAVTGEDGTYALRLPDGLGGTLRVSHPMFKEAFTKQFTVVAEMNDGEWKLSGDPAGALEVHFGGITPGAEPDLLMALIRGGERKPVSAFVTQHDWRATSLAPGRYTLHAIPVFSPWRPMAQPVEITGGTTTKVTLQLQGCPPVTGVVRDGGGKPITTGEATIRVAWPPAEGLAWSGRVGLDGDTGKFGGMMVSFSREERSYSWGGRGRRRTFTLGKDFIAWTTALDDQGRFTLPTVPAANGALRVGNRSHTWHDAPLPDRPEHFEIGPK